LTINSETIYPFNNKYFINQCICLSIVIPAWTTGKEGGEVQQAIRNFVACRHPEARVRDGFHAAWIPPFPGGMTGTENL
jgi:hypothetical protein